MYLRKSSIVLWFVRKAWTFAPAQLARHTSFPNEMPLALTFSNGSQQSNIDSSNHLQGPFTKIESMNTLLLTTLKLI